MMSAHCRTKGTVHTATTHSPVCNRKRDTVPLSLSVLVAVRALSPKTTGAALGPVGWHEASHFKAEQAEKDVFCIGRASTLPRCGFAWPVESKDRHGCSPSLAESAPREVRGQGRKCRDCFLILQGRGEGTSGPGACPNLLVCPIAPSTGTNSSLTGRCGRDYCARDARHARQERGERNENSEAENQPNAPQCEEKRSGPPRPCFRLLQ